MMNATVNDEKKKRVGRPPAKKLLSIADIAGQVDPSASMAGIERQARNPFANYPVRLVEARYFPRDKALDDMSKEELLQYCIRNELFADEWRITRGIFPKSKDQHEKILEIKTDWEEGKIVSFIDARQTHTFPAHHLVFTNIVSPKPGLAHMQPVKSWITNRYRMIHFHMPWPLPTPEKPYAKGKPNQCAIIDDDSIRAQLFFVREVRTGKVIPNKDGNRAKYFLLKDEAEKSLAILRRIYDNGTKGSPDLRLWKKEEGELPEVAD